MKINFDKMSDDEFAKFVDMAIDGRLLYDNFPSDEYKYFSKLSKLGYKNRHDGWSKEICEEKQKEYRDEYYSDKEHRERFFRMACTMQENIRKGEVMISEVNKAENQEDKFKYALQALELITCQEGFTNRNFIRNENND